MKLKNLFYGLACSAVIGTVAHGATIYQNTFDSGASSLSRMTPYGSGTVTASGGQVSVTLDASGHAGVALLIPAVSPLYSVLLRSNAGVITWSVNVANQDGPSNNQFAFVLACNSLDPYAIWATGYALVGGGFVSNRMMLRRFDYGIGGGGRTIVDIESARGLGVLPAKGSFKVTYDPSSDTWAVFAHIGSGYIDPRFASTPLGSGVDSTYTSGYLQYCSLNGLGSGVDYFDNLNITVGPQPPLLLSMRLAGDSVALSWPAYGSNLVLETASDFLGTNWEAVQTPVLVQNESCLATTLLELSSRYYRLRSQEHE